jgi:hypothetical protein
MQNPDTGMFVTAEDEATLLKAKEAFLDAMEPAKRSSLQDDRLWPIFRNGETVHVRNESGAEAKCVVESIGKKFIRLRGIKQ